MAKHRKLGITLGALVAALGCCPAIAPPFSVEAAAATVGDSAAVDQTTVRVRGRIERYDVEHRQLRVATGSGPAEFAVPQTAHVSRRGVRIDVRELEHLAGSAVVVRYYPDADGHLTVTSIHVLASSETPRP
jgi:hypothetical protein